MSYAHYQAIRLEFGALLAELQHFVLNADLEFTLILLDANEFGVALEEICGILRDNAQPIPATLCSKLEQMSIQLQYDVNEWAYWNPCSDLATE